MTIRAPILPDARIDVLLAEAIVDAATHRQVHCEDPYTSRDVP